METKEQIIPEVEATETWEEFESFVQAIMQVKPEEIREGAASRQP
jgi:hypothetical protein